MTHITFKRIAPRESRIYLDGDLIGEVYRQDDMINRGARFWVIHLDEDWRGPQRVHDRRRIRDVTRRLVSTHPFYR